jgi:hypothetical protein
MEYAMAIWHFDFYLLPSSFVAGVSLDVNSVDLSWSDAYETQELVEFCERNCRPKESWHSALQIWQGPGDTNIELWYENDQYRSIFFRIDLRIQFWPFIESVFDIARYLMAQVYCPEEKIIIPPEEEILSPIIVDSNAGQFVVDPRGFLRKPPKQRPT